MAENMTINESEESPEESTLQFSKDPIPIPADDPLVLEAEPIVAEPVQAEPIIIPSHGVVLLDDGVDEETSRRKIDNHSAMHSTGHIKNTKPRKW